MVKKVRSAPATELRGAEVGEVRTTTISRRKGWERRRRRSAAALARWTENGNVLKKKEEEEDPDRDGNEAVEMKAEEISVSFPASCSSDQSSENDVAATEKSDTVEKSEEVAVDEAMMNGDKNKNTTTSHGFSSVIGRRREMEDAVTVETKFIESANGVGENFDFFGVFDGHGGAHVARCCHEQMHLMVANEVREEMSSGGVVVNWEKVMAGSFGKMDEQVSSDKAEEAMKTVGSTAVVAVVGKEQLVVANCGDSRAVICRGGVAVPLSSDHKVLHLSALDL